MNLFSFSVSSYLPTNGEDPLALEAKTGVVTITGGKAGEREPRRT